MCASNWLHAGSLPPLPQEPLHFTLIMIWVEINFMGWISMWIVFGLGRSGLYVNASWDGLTWIKMNILCKTIWILKLKKSRIHTIKYLNLIEIYWRWLNMTSNYFLQSSVVRSICGPHTKSRILEIKSHVHTIKLYRNLLKFIGDDSVWLAVTLCKTMWLKL